MTTGQRMKARRKEIGLSAERVAEILGVSPATIYRYENGDIEKVPGDRLEPIAVALQTTPQALMGWEEFQKAPTQEDGPELPHEHLREVLAEGGMHLLLDADAKLPEEHLEEIIEFIKMKQRKYGR